MNEIGDITTEENCSIPELEEENGRGRITALSSLLKFPGLLIHRIDKDDHLLSLATQLLLLGLVFHATYGFAMGLFDSMGVAFMTAGKAPLIALASLVLCMPSLYVFSCVAGMPITLTQAFALASTATAMTGLLLLGLTPVTWLFSVSTNNLAFVVVMNIVAWSIAVGFSLRFFAGLALTQHLKETTGLKWWLFVYIIVSLQMATTMRPLLGKATEGWREPGKKFFLAHLSDSISAQQKVQTEPLRGK